jgi:3-phenylpropionate/trans-cinnamate dioxygenase ferredoxin component
MSDGMRVCGVDEIADGGVRVVPRDVVGTGDDITVFNDEGALYALDDTCTHALASLAEGWVEDGTVECPLHAARFSLRTGEALSLPATQPARCHRVEVRDGDVWLFPGEPPVGDD